MDERIVISVEDRVARSVPTKFREIATQADAAATRIERLKTALRGITTPPGITALVRYLQQLNVQMSSMSGSSSSAALAIARLQAAMNAAALSSQRLATEQQRTILAAQRVATEQQRTAAAMNAAAAAAARLASAHSNAAAAASNAAAAAARATTAQANAATAAATAAARLAQAQANATRATNEARISTIRLAEAQRGATSSSGALTSSLQRLAGVAGSLGASMSGVGILKMMDEYTGLNNRVKMVTDTVEAQDEAMGRLRDISVSTFGDLKATTTLFARIDRSMNFMGRSQEDTLRITETINKAIAVGGLNAQEAASAMLQLSQAFNSGRLNGDEFRSVAENMPMFLDKVAEATGRSILELKKMAEEGEITADVMVSAFDIMAEDVDAAFKSFVPRMSNAFSVLKTEATFFFGEFDKSAGVTRAISLAIIALSQNMQAVASYGAAAAIVFGTYFAGSLLMSAGAAVVLQRALLATGLLALVVLVGYAIDYFMQLSNELGSASAAFDTLYMIGSEAMGRLGDILRGVSEIMGGVVGSIATAVVGIINQLSRAGSYAIETAKVVAQNLWIAISNGIGGLIQGVQTKLAEMINMIIAQINNLIVRLNEVVGTAFSTINELVINTDGFGPQDMIDLPAWADATGGLEDIVASTSTATAELFEQGFERISEAVSKPLESYAALEEAQRMLARNKPQEELSALRAADEAARANYEAELAAINAADADRAGAKAKKDGAGARGEEKKTLASILDDMNTEMEMLQMMSKEREVAQTVMGHQEELAKAGIQLSEQEFDLLTERVKLLQYETELARERDSILGDTLYKREQELTKIKAIAQLQGAEGFTRGDTATAIMSTGVGEFFEGSGIDYAARVAEMQSYYAQVAALRDADLINAQQASQANIRIWIAEQNIKTQRYGDFFGGIAELAKSGNERLAAIGKAAAIAQAVISTYQSATSAYAAMAGIPVVGPALGAVAAAAAVAAGLANVAAIRSQSTSVPGYRDGGYTGSGAVNDVVGVVHGQEYVMDAAATSRIGVSNLEALQRGSASVAMSNSPVTSGSGSDTTNQIEPTFNFFVVGSETEAQEMAATMPGNAWFMDMARKNKKSLKRELEG
jgi:tape measure domain-containing protein